MSLIWNNGRMEGWNNGCKENNLSWVIQVPFPAFHYSSIPTFQMSGNIEPP